MITIAGAQIRAKASGVGTYGAGNEEEGEQMGIEGTTLVEATK